MMSHVPWEQVAVFAIIVAALAYLVRSALRRGDEGGCGGCHGCGSSDKSSNESPAPAPLVQIELTPPRKRSS